jgi:hypothetical protein
MRPIFSLKDRDGEGMHRVRFFRFAWITSALLVVAQAALPAWRILPLVYGQTAVPLHYNIHFGVDTIGAWWRIFTVPVVGLAFLLLNAGLAKFFFKRERALSVVAAASTLTLEVILFGAIVFIVLLNISYG